MDDGVLPVFDLSDAIESGVCSASQCAEIARCFAETSCAIVRDPRVDVAENGRFLDMMQRYFEQSYDEIMLDERPDLHYQVGVTPEGTEIPRSLNDGELLTSVDNPSEANRPIAPTGADPKWRFFWKIGSTPQKTCFGKLNADMNVCPRDGFPEWKEVMDAWGTKMMGALEIVARALALGAGLDSECFVRLMECGPHLVAPTGVDLGRYGKLNTCIAGFHYDLNFLTIHGKARFPGLHIWLRDGRKLPVKIPEGCLLVQAGKQLEWLTGGAVRAGFHEVICSEATIKAFEKARENGESVWRVSSTVFGHLASDEMLKPLREFEGWAGFDAGKYPATRVGSYVTDELSVIKLKTSKDSGGKLQSEGVDAPLVV
ncbi:hypothetical protein BSKO_10371 [Bryopsis sp. KO-2023]|nr:hypothetical protein BSKO_10371 [Bryopsis sp. KO-2023]